MTRKMCRACLATKETFTYFIHQNVSQDLFWFCTSVKVLPNDNLPKALCDSCYDLLKQFYKFKHACIQSNEALTRIGDYVKSAPDDDKALETCSDGKSLLHTLAVDVKTEYECSENSQDDSLEPVQNSDVIEKKVKSQRYKKKGKPQFKTRKGKRQFCFKCEHCNKKFVDADRYEGHKMTHEGKPETIECQPCNKTFLTWYGLTRHKKHVHTTVSLDSLRCTLCGKVSKNEQTLRMHLSRHGRQEDVVMCDVCGRVCKSKTTLKCHLATHEKERPRPFTCEQCGNKFHEQTSLQAHIRKRHSDQRFVCDVCGHQYRDKFSLLNHILRHDGKKIFLCDLCPKSFAGKSALVDHKRLHSGEKPYACSVCNKRFITRRILTEHTRIHTGLKPHRCSLCGLAFTQRGTMKRHMKVHDTTASTQVTGRNLVAKVDIAFQVTKTEIS